MVLIVHNVHLRFTWMNRQFCGISTEKSKQNVRACVHSANSEKNQIRIVQLRMCLFNVDDVWLFNR